MQVLFITYKYPPSIGGMETMSYHLVHGVTQLMPTHLIAIKESEKLVSFFLSLKKRIAQYLKLNPSINIIHVNDGLLGIWISRFIDDYPHIKFCVTIHGLEASFPLSLYQRKFKSAIAKYHSIVTVSNFTQKLLLNKGLPQHKITTILNGVDTEPFLKNEVQSLVPSQKYSAFDDKIVLLSVGRAVPRKGFSWFAKYVMPTLDDNFIYLVVGPNKVKHSPIIKFLPLKWRTYYYMALGAPTDAVNIQKLEVKDRIMHLGKVSDEELSYLYNIATIIIVPNIEVTGDVEGFGLVALEAAIRSKVVFASHIQGLQDAIINNKNGKSIPPHDVKEWHQQINRYAYNDDLRANLAAEAGAFTARNYSWSKMAQSYYSLFNSLTSNMHKPPVAPLGVK